MRTLILCFFVVLAMVGSFFAGNYFVGNVRNVEGAYAPDILEEAKKAVPPVVLPPKPSGQIVTTLQHVTTEVPEVHVEKKLVNFGPLKTLVPQVVTTMKSVITDVPSTTLVDAPLDEITKWNNEVRELQGHYEQELREKVAEIARERQKERAAEILSTTKDVFNEMIIPFITALTGLIGAISAFRYGTKPAP
jgi:hypothetical protein